MIFQIMKNLMIIFLENLIHIDYIDIFDLAKKFGIEITHNS